MSPDAQREMLNAAIANATKDIMAEQPKRSAEQLLIERANAVIKDCQRTFVNRCVLRGGTRPSVNQTIEEIYGIYRDAFKDWSPDELLALYSMQSAIMAAETLRDAGVIA